MTAWPKYRPRGKPIMQCKLCGSPDGISLVTSRCKTCQRLIVQARNTGATGRRIRIDVSAAEAAIANAVKMRQELYPDLSSGYVCAYSRIILQVSRSNSASGAYASFDHVVPNVADKAALCSRIINDLKGWMTDTEFDQFVCDVLDVNAPRRLHGQSEQVSREYLTLLKKVKRAGPAEAGLREALARLQELSAGFQY